MQNIIDSLRTVIGEPNFYLDGVLQLDSVFEYFVASLILVVVVSSIFKILVGVFQK